MSGSSDRPGMFAASGSSAATASDARLPPDEHLVEPETRYEVIDGERVYVVPADPPHATEQVDLDYLLRAHVAPGYLNAADMLTRTSATSDYAPDASVYPAAPDPDTGGRQLEELAFEIASTQSMASVTRKARGLSDRGVRRVFCLDIRRPNRRRALEWSRPSGDWVALDPGGAIDDRCFIRPLPVVALLDAAVRDDEVARALVAKNNPVIAGIRAEGIAEGHATGRVEGTTETRAEYIVRTLAARGLEVPDELRARILECRDLEQLDRWFTRALTATSVADVMGPEPDP